MNLQSPSTTDESQTPSLHPLEVSIAPHSVAPSEPAPPRVLTRGLLFAAGTWLAFIGALVVHQISGNGDQVGELSASLSRVLGDHPLDTGAANEERSSASALNTLSVQGTVEFDPRHVADVKITRKGFVSRVASFEGDRVERDALLAVVDAVKPAIDNVSAHGVLVEAAPAQVLRSPISGTVIERGVAAGQTVGNEFVAFRVANLDRVRVELRVPLRASTQVRVGDRVDLQSHTSPELVLIGRVAQLGRSAAQGNLPISVVVDNIAHHLSIGQGVLARIYPSGGSSVE